MFCLFFYVVVWLEDYWLFFSLSGFFFSVKIAYYSKLSSGLPFNHPDWKSDPPKISLNCFVTKRKVKIFFNTDVRFDSRLLRFANLKV
jgi:hypothetical protein